MRRIGLLFFVVLLSACSSVPKISSKANYVGRSPAQSSWGESMFNLLIESGVSASETDVVGISDLLCDADVGNMGYVTVKSCSAIDDVSGKTIDFKAQQKDPSDLSSSKAHWLIYTLARTGINIPISGENAGLLPVKKIICTKLSNNTFCEAMIALPLQSQ